MWIGQSILKIGNGFAIRTPEEVIRLKKQWRFFQVGQMKITNAQQESLGISFGLNLLRVDQIANDVDGDRASHLDELMTSSDPIKFFVANKAAIENAWALGSHIISTLKLSNCNPANQAAVVMEVVLFVARSLVSNREIRCSSATAICLASSSPQYDGPEWFVKKLADIIR